LRHSVVSAFSTRRIDRRKCYQLSSTVASLSHWALTFCYLR